MKQEKLKITCTDGVELSAILIEPEKPKAVVQLNTGTGAKKEFYLPFANFLAENSFAVCTFDYRGTAESAPISMKDCEYNYVDYGLQDMPAVLDFLDEKYPDLKKFIVGHSVGGQKIGFMPNHHKISGLVMVGTSSGYWKTMYLPYKLKTFFFFWIFSPISIWLKGYVAAKRFGIMEDLPRNIVKAWAAWCSVPDYFWNKKFYQKNTDYGVPKGHYEDLNFPIKHYWASDDPIANQKNVEILLSFWKSTKGISSEKLSPEDFGMKAIDHFGFFKRQFRDTIWKKFLDNLNEFLTSDLENRSTKNSV